jgi:hypothetical protein
MNTHSGNHGPNYSGSMTNHKDLPSYLERNQKFMKRKSGNSGSKDKSLKNAFSSKFKQNFKNFTNQIKIDQKNINSKITRIGKNK